MKQWFQDTEHQTIKDNFLRYKKQMKRAIWLPSLLPGQFPGCGTVRENSELGSLSELSRQSWESEETKAARVCRAEDQSGEICIEKELQRSAGLLWGFSWIIISTYFEETSWGHTRHYLKELEEIITKTHKELGIVFVPTNWNNSCYYSL